MKSFTALISILFSLATFSKTIDTSEDNVYLNYKDACISGQQEACVYLTDKCFEKSDTSACRVAGLAYSLKPDEEGRKLGFELLVRLCNSKDKIACKYQKDSKFVDDRYKKQNPGWQSEEALSKERRRNQIKEAELQMKIQIADGEAQRARDNANTGAQIKLIQSMSPKEPEKKKSFNCQSSYNSHFMTLDTNCNEK